jgi:hypothetical protein
MHIITRAVVAVVVGGIGASPVQAAEGVLIVERTVAGATTRTSQMQIERDRMRAEMAGPNGETIVVFDGPQQVMRMISVDRKTYTEMTKADADRMGAQVGAAMAGMKEKLASLPPEQRAKMEAMMARIGGAGAALGAAAKPDYRRAGSDKAGKWTCDKYEGFRNGEKISEVCTVDPKVLGLTMADFEISKQVAAFFEKMLPQAADQIFAMGTPEAQGFSGVPVRRINYSGGKVQSTSELTDVRRQTFPDSSYDVPAGFQKQTMGRMGGRP